MMVSVGRGEVAKLLLALPLSLSPLLPRTASAAGEVVAPAFSKYQSDDKSWDLSLPAGWRLDEKMAVRGEFPEHIYHVRAARSDGSAALDVLVDKTKAPLKELGADAETVGRAFGAGAQLASASLEPGAVKGSSYYEFSYTNGAGRRRLKLGLQQNRLYSLSVSTQGSATADVRSEVEQIVASFKAFPVNIICIGQSNGGTIPAPGSCY